mmetsp:Transcript_53352/g.98655  ORF Transcript_53352/g.98655 Transcript_53352/m.98655 type:complete len:205 (-) Transcript_53352:301-915(-)
MRKSLKANLQRLRPLPPHNSSCAGYPSVSSLDRHSSAHVPVHDAGARVEAVSSTISISWYSPVGFGASRWGARSPCINRCRLSGTGLSTWSGARAPRTSTSSCMRLSTTATAWDKFKDGQWTVLKRQTSLHNKTASVDNPTSSEPKTRAITSWLVSCVSQMKPTSAHRPASSRNCKVGARKFRPTRPEKATTRVAPVNAPSKAP